MDNRIFQAAAIATPPGVEVAPSSGYPTDGNPAGGIPATVPGAAWFHQLGEELRGVIVAAGLTPDDTVLTQLLTALRSVGVFTTPAQFDATTKVATTDFVAKNSGRMAGNIAINANTALTAANHVGKVVQMSGAGPYAATLPLASSVPSGAQILLVCTASGTVTIQRTGADLIYPAFQAGIASFFMVSGDTALLESDGALWAIVGGAIILNRAPQFGANLGGSGYQKLPSGLIIQWGSASTNGSVQPGTWPIAFPTAAIAVFSSNAQNNANWANTFNPTLTGFGYQGVSGGALYYLGIGY